MGFDQECFPCQQLAFRARASSCAIVFKWITEFCRDQSSFLDEEHIRKLLLTIVAETVSAIWKILINDNCCTYQIIQKNLQLYIKLFMENCA